MEKCTVYLFLNLGSGRVRCTDISIDWAFILRFETYNSLLRRYLKSKESVVCIRFQQGRDICFLLKRKAVVFYDINFPRQLQNHHRMLDGSSSWYIPRHLQQFQEFIISKQSNKKMENYRNAKNGCGFLSASVLSVLSYVIIYIIYTYTHI